MGTSIRKNGKIIIVIGHLVWDRIQDVGGTWRESIGGTAYSWAALGSQLRNKAVVYPVCNVGHDLNEKAMACFGRFPALDFSLMRIISRENKIHELIYRESGCREEINYGEMPLIRPPAPGLLPHIDVALINYIGGDEFPPRFLRQLKRDYAPLIYLDYHSLALGRQMLNRRQLKVRRFLRVNPHWQAYMASADIVQMNHYELQSILPDLQAETPAVVQAAIKIHSIGPKIVIITREGEDLVIIYSHKGRAKTEVLPVLPVNKLVDPTGCGDTFAAGFIAEYVQSRNIVKAARQGMVLANRKAAFAGIDGFIKLRGKT